MPRNIFLFPGQGAQKVGMGKTLHDSLPAARRLFDEAAELLGWSLADVCFNGLEHSSRLREQILDVGMSAIQSVVNLPIDVTPGYSA